MKHLKFILAIIIMLAIVILVVENYEALSTRVVFKIDLFTLHYQSLMISLYYIVPIAFLIGVLITGLYGMVERFHLKRQIKDLIKESKEKSEELNSLRNLPITSDDVGSSDLNNSYE